MHFYIYTDGHHQELLSFDELLITFDENGEGIRTSHAMSESQFLTYLANQNDGMVQYWFLNDHSLTDWYYGHIELYNENHSLFGNVDRHEEYLETITENKERLQNCYCMSDFVCGACR